MRTGIVVGALVLASLSATQTTSSVAAEGSDGAGPANCWVSWRPSTGSVKVRNATYNRTVFDFKLTWRAEDLTFTTCRDRTAIELETFLRTDRKIDAVIDRTNLPRAYVDGARISGELTFGVGDAEKLKAGKTYSLTLVIGRRLDRGETLNMVAGRGYRIQRCAGPEWICVNGWNHSEQFGPFKRITVFRPTRVKDGTSFSWSYPSRTSLYGRIVRHPQQGDAHLVDAAGVRHWIPDGGTYNCLVGAGYVVANSFAGLDQRWVINSFPQGSNASCSPGSQPPPPPPDGATISLAQGAAAPAGYWYAVTLSGFAAGQSLTVTCRDSVDPGGFYDQTFTTDANGGASDSTLCYSNDHPDHWVTADAVESNHVTW